MKKMTALVLPALVVGALTLAPARAKADAVDDLYASLVQVVVNIDEFDNLVYVNDVDILDYNYVNVSDVLSDDDIAILSILLDDDPIASFNQGLLDDILQFAGVLDQNQIVVGVLSDQGIIYFLDEGF